MKNTLTGISKKDIQLKSGDSFSIEIDSDGLADICPSSCIDSIDRDRESAKRGMRMGVSDEFIEMYEKTDLWGILMTMQIISKSYRKCESEINIDAWIMQRDKIKEYFNI